MTSALSWPIDNLGELARCRASIERIITLYNDTEVFEQARPDAERASGRVACLRSALPELLIRRLSLATPDGRLLLDDFNLRVRRGERLLITGDPAVTASLFKAVAGLWPWGHGEILLPSDGDMMFLPQQPLLPEGSLRAALSYPHDPARFEPAALHYALECAGIAWLAPRLDDSDDWSRVLPLRAQQRLGIARVFLQRPGWIFIEEATSTFDAKTRICMVEMLHRELPSATLLNISQQDDPDHHYTGRLVLGPARRHATPAAAAKTSDKA